MENGMDYISSSPNDSRKTGGMCGAMEFTQEFKHP
jgi:hypothetical protein